ncbi:MAG: BatA domain-containing protein [Luteibaculum sp.]
MSFASPLFLYALGLLAIPVLIHLFSFYIPKKVMFTQVQLLRQVQQENKRASRIRNWVLLALRMLALAFLVLAFAEPFLPAKSGLDKSSAIGIYVDNSFSMETGGLDQSNFGRVKSEAQQLVGSQSENQMFVLASNQDITPKPISKQEALEWLGSLQIGNLPASWNQISKLHNRHPDADPIVVLSDFQRDGFSEDLQGLDSTKILIVNQQGRELGNLSIDSVAVNQPIVKQGQQIVISAWVNNRGNEVRNEVPVYLNINGQQKAPARINANPQSLTRVDFPILVQSEREIRGEISIDDSPIEFDNHFFFSLPVEKQVSITHFGTGKNKALEKLFGADPDFSFEHSDWNQFDLEKLQNRKQTLVITGIKEFASGNIQALTDFVTEGGNLLLCISEEAKIGSYQQLLDALGGPLIESKTEAISWGELEMRDNFFEGVFEENPERLSWPKCNYSFPLKPRPTNSVLLRSAANKALLVKQEVELGNLFVYGGGLDEGAGNLTRHGLFAPLLLRISEYAKSNNQLYYVLDQDEYFKITVPDTVSRENINLVMNEQRLLPACADRSSYLNCYGKNLPLQEGIYDVQIAEQKFGSIAINNNRRESKLEYLDSKELEGILEKSAVQFQLLTSDLGGNGLGKKIFLQDIELWPYCLALALFFLLAEMIWVKWSNRKTS